MLSILLMFGFLAAQVPTGRILGKVTDAEGTPLPGVSVIADSIKLVGQATAVTDATGTYRLFSLPAGQYSVRFTLPGFERLTRRDIIVQLDQTTMLNISLKQSTIEEEVTVVGQSPLIDVKSTVKGSTMTREVFMQLPRNRNFTGLLSTVPGVQLDTDAGRSGYGTTVGLTVDGASGAENIWYIDGTDITSIHRGFTNQGIVMEQLDEVKVTASGYNAEFGGSMGGVVSVISRSGSNAFHGDVFGYYNNDTLLMRGKDRQSLRLDPYDQTKYQYYSNDQIYFNDGKDRDDNQRFEGVFNLSGFILKDKLWFFGSFNPIYNPVYGDRFFTSDPVDITKAKIPGNTALDPQQGRPLYNFYAKNYNLNWQAKLTTQPFKNMRMSVSANNNFSYYYGQIPGLAGTGSKNFPYNVGWENTIVPTKDKEPGFDYPNWSGNATIDYTMSNNFLISFRSGISYTNTTNQQLKMPGTRWSFDRANTTYPEIPASLQHFAGWTNWSGSTSEIVKWYFGRISGNLDATYYANLFGEHAFKFGVQYQRLHEDCSNAIQHPNVTISWGNFYDMPDGTRVQGTYGYYSMISDWKSQYGYVWTISSNNWAFYLQDSWTIADKLTVNFGIRNESEYIPAFSQDKTEAGWSDKPFKFGFLFKGKFWDKFAPRLGVIYDVFGDSSLKVFGSYNIYYDVMKLYIAEGTTGGFKWWTSYYTLDNYNWDQIAASGDINNKTDQAAGGTYMGSRNWRHTAFQTIDPNLKPVAQSELSFGADKKVSEDISVGARLVYKHLIRTIEDVGVLEYDAEGNVSESYYQANPGFGYTLPESKGGKMLDTYWPCPKAKREYWGLNLSIEKRFSNNWQAGFNYTWSSLRGNYAGLNSSDESGRWGANQNRYFDLWFERYDIHGNPIDGPLPTDRTHYLKAYGSYVFPFGLTVGVVAYGRSGAPRSTTIPFNDMTIYPDNYGDLGRYPFLFYGDIYVEYNLRFAKKYLVNLNLTINNFTNTKTLLTYYNTPVRTMIRATDAQHLSKTFDWKAEIPTHTPDPRYGLANSYFGPWSARVGARFSF